MPTRTSSPAFICAADYRSACGFLHRRWFISCVGRDRPSAPGLHPPSARSGARLAIAAPIYPFDRALGARALARRARERYWRGPMTVMRHMVIRGRVQGVGYRAFVEYTALEHGLEGWVRNRRDGSRRGGSSRGPPSVVARCSRLAGAGRRALGSMRSMSATARRRSCGGAGQGSASRSSLRFSVSTSHAVEPRSVHRESLHVQTIFETLGPASLLYGEGGR